MIEALPEGIIVRPIGTIDEMAETQIFDEMKRVDSMNDQIKTLQKNDENVVAVHWSKGKNPISRQKKPAKKVKSQKRRRVKNTRKANPAKSIKNIRQAKVAVMTAIVQVRARAQVHHHKILNGQ